MHRNSGGSIMGSSSLHSSGGSSSGSGKDDASYMFECSSHSGTVLGGLHSLRSKGLLFDVTLCVQGEKFQAHRAVLAACSDYFRAMFTDAMKESRQDEITLNGVTSTGAKHLLDYAYTAKLSLNLGNIHDLLGAASHLQILPVVGACADFLHSQLDVDNCIDVLTLAETYTLLPLQKTAYCYVGRHFEKLSWLPQFQRLSASQLQQLLRQDYPIECAEIDILRSVMKWLLGGGDTGEEIIALLHYQRISREQEAKFKESPLFSEFQEHSIELTTKLLGHFVRARARDVDHADVQPSGIVNVRGFEAAIVNVGGFKALRGVSNDLTYYHASSKTWKYLTTIPHIEQCDYGIAVCRNQLYVVGGCFNQSLQEHIHAYGFRYDPSTGDWTAIRPMVHERCRFHLAAVHDRLYAIGGIGEGDELPEGSCECYDITSNTWYEVAPMPLHITQQAGAVLHDKIYVTGGIDPVDEEPLQQFCCYDPANGVWEELSPMLAPRCDHAMVAHKHRLYVAGGWQMDAITLNRDLLATLDCYDLESHQWTTLTHTPTPRYHASMVVLADTLYLIGGTEGQFNRTTKKMETYSLESETWGTAPDYPVAIWEHLTAIMFIPTCLESRPIEPSS